MTQPDGKVCTYKKVVSMEASFIYSIALVIKIYS